MRYVHIFYSWSKRLKPDERSCVEEFSWQLLS
jgi:hypothetical protein